MAAMSMQLALSGQMGGQQLAGQAVSAAMLAQYDPSAPRVKELGRNCELRLIVDDDKHARIMLMGDATPPPPKISGLHSIKPVVTTSAEIFGAEMVPGQEYPLLGGTRTAVYTWHGCKIRISGPTRQEYDAPNVVMRDYLSCAAVLEQKRQRADDLHMPAPRVLVCGNAFSGKSSLCQILCNYALRREHTPIFVDLDTRYSSIRQLQGLPACVTAMPVEHAADEEPARRLAYYFGHIDWSDNPKLYERVVSHLSRVVFAKLSHTASAEGARVASSGCVINAPFQPTNELLLKIIEMFEVDVVFVIDNEWMHASLAKAFATLPKVNGMPKVEVVPLPKAGGVVQDTPQRLRKLRALRIRDYFYGVMRDFYPQSVLVDLGDVQLVQIEAATLPAGMLPHGAQADASKNVEFIVRSFSGTPAQLQHALLAVVRASSMNEVLYAPICGLVLVTKVEEHALQLLCPAPPPLPTFSSDKIAYLLVGDYQRLKFIDI